MYIIHLHTANRFWSKRGWSSQRVKAKRYTQTDAARIAASLGGPNYVEVIAS